MKGGPQPGWAQANLQLKTNKQKLLIDDVLESFPQYLGFHISVSEDTSGLLLGVLQNETVTS